MSDHIHGTFDMHDKEFLYVQILKKEHSGKMDTQSAGHGEINRQVEQPSWPPGGTVGQNDARGLPMPHKNMKKEPRLGQKVQTFQNGPQTTHI